MIFHNKNANHSSDQKGFRIETLFDAESFWELVNMQFDREDNVSPKYQESFEKTSSLLAIHTSHYRIKFSDIAVFYQQDRLRSKTQGN